MSDERSGRRYLLRYHLAETLLQGPFVVIGREPGCDVRVDDTTISRTHARLRVLPTGVWIEDLGSRNGVVVAGQRLGREPVELEVGASFYLGSHRFTLAEVTRAPRDPSVDTTTVPTQREAPAAAVCVTAPIPAATEVAPTMSALDATDGMLLAGRIHLAAVSRPVSARFCDALYVVQDLAAASADGKARLLLAEALDLLATRPPVPELSPFLVATVRSMVSRWSAQTETPVWKRRLSVLESWKRV